MKDTRVNDVNMALTNRTKPASNEPEVDHQTPNTKSRLGSVNQIPSRTKALPSLVAFIHLHLPKDSGQRWCQPAEVVPSTEEEGGRGHGLIRKRKAPLRTRAWPAACRRKPQTSPLQPEAIQSQSVHGPNSARPS